MRRSSSADARVEVSTEKQRPRGTRVKPSRWRLAHALCTSTLELLQRRRPGGWMQGQSSPAEQQFCPRRLAAQPCGRRTHLGRAQLDPSSSGDDRGLGARKRTPQPSGLDMAGRRHYTASMVRPGWALKNGTGRGAPDGAACEGLALFGGAMPLT